MLRVIMKKIESSSFFIGRQGDGIISFGSGQPDLPPPKEVFSVLSGKQRTFKYGLIQGEERLRNLLANEYKGSDAHNFVICNGASEALDLIFRVLSGDLKRRKVLMPRPYYYSYPFIVKFAGLTPVFTDLKDGRIDLNDFEKKVRGCAAVLINSPSNPTGRVENIETLKQIEKITQNSGIHLISDEVYKDLIYERENYVPKGKRVITVNSFSKTFGMCGLRVGYLYSPDKDLVQKTIEMKVHTSMNTNTMAQEMAAAALLAPKSYIEKQKEIWKKRRDFIYQGLLDLGLDLWRPEGAFYVFPRVKNSSKVVYDLYYKYKVIVYDGSWFGSPDRIRLSYALDIEKIKEGLKRIGNYVKNA
ncbi:pyridoxal phosphate-dependent aminotransferase [Patescibacteria group bacterium]|nr:MAG: pyridoxal phosphate-dependent aminotransferase [Patescibacteria group bacterium]